MTNRRIWGTGLVALLMVITVACSNGELEDARAEIEDLESTVSELQSTNAELSASVSSLEDDVDELGALTSELEEEREALAAEKDGLQTTLEETAQDLVLQADIVGDGCMLQNRYVNDGERKATFRVRVYDPITGEQMDDTVLESVTVEIDDQTFDLAWGPHPPDTEVDFFWTYGWEIFAGYPAGNIAYTITATATDGRTGEFEPFNVVPSLLTVVDAAAQDA